MVDRDAREMTQQDPNSALNYSPFPHADPPVADPAIAPHAPVVQPRPAETPTAPEQESSKTWRQRLSAITGSGSLIGMISAIVTLVGGVVALIFLFWPNLRPDEGPTAMGAELSNSRIESGVTYGEYWERRKELILAKNPQTTEPTDEQRAFGGIVVTFQVVIEGYAQRPNLVRWTMLDAASGGRLDNHPELTEAPGWPDKYIVPTAARDQVNAEIWVSLPAEPGPYTLLIEVIDPDGIPLAAIETDEFSGSPRTTPTPTTESAREPTPNPTNSATLGGAFPTLAPIGTSDS